MTTAKLLCVLHLILSSPLPPLRKNPHQVTKHTELGRCDDSSNILSTAAVWVSPRVPSLASRQHFSITASLFHTNREERVEAIGSKITNQNAPWKFSLSLSLCQWKDNLLLAEKLSKTHQCGGKLADVIRLDATRLLNKCHVKDGSKTDATTIRDDLIDGMMAGSIICD